MMSKRETCKLYPGPYPSEKQAADVVLLIQMIVPIWSW